MDAPGYSDHEKDLFLAQLKRKGIRDRTVLEAMATVPREQFVGLDLAEFAYDDAPLPIDEGQTISQPFMVALMTEALQLTPGSKVLEVGTGSGYAAAVLSRVVKRVYSVERHQSLAHQASTRLKALGYDNVKVLCGDGTLGWPEHAPYDAIVVAAGAPEAPRSLIEQLVVGGRLVIPAGPTLAKQNLLRITRVSEDEVKTEELGAVRFVPLIGEEGWPAVKAKLSSGPRPGKVHKPEPVAELVKQAAEHIPAIKSANLDGLMERIGDARVVLLGEATHGTAEFYDMRAHISRELIRRKGFNFIAVEADWPDAAQVDHFIRGTRSEPGEEIAFSRFPTWMWANRQVLEFVKWLRDYNQQFPDPDHAVGFYGLDLYSLYSSIDTVIRYLDEVDESAAEVARQRYGCLTPWQKDPASYGAMAVNDKHRSCEPQVVEILNDIMDKRLHYAAANGRRYLDAVANARLVKNAEKYYRVMYQGSAESWNQRDTHMFDSLQHLLEFHGKESKAIVWAHNSHIGNAEATEMSHRGEINLGYLCRQHFAQEAYLIGFGTHTGTVAAASNWGAPMEIKQVRPSHPDSYEQLCHDTGLDAFLLPLSDGRMEHVKALRPPRLQRAIGVIYRPETELDSHYFTTSLPHQFDEYIWFDETHAVDALGPESGKGLPATFPFGL